MHTVDRVSRVYYFLLICGTQTPPPFSKVCMSVKNLQNPNLSDVLHNFDR